MPSCATCASPPSSLRHLRVSVAAHARSEQPPAHLAATLACVASWAALPAVQYTLVLRKWSNLYPQAQYRCFVKGLRLVGIAKIGI